MTGYGDHGNARADGVTQCHACHPILSPAMQILSFFRGDYRTGPVSAGWERKLLLGAGHHGADDRKLFDGGKRLRVESGEVARDGQRRVFGRKRIRDEGVDLLAPYGCGPVRACDAGHAGSILLYRLRSLVKIPYLAVRPSQEGFTKTPHGQSR